MKPLSKPEHFGYDIYLNCISNTTHNRPYYESISLQILSSENNYDIHASTNTLHSLPILNQTIFYDELKYLYDSKMVSKKGICRNVYDEIKLLANNGICPLCNQRTVSTLDHHIPKKIHPEFSVLPLNLVPSCKDCNLTKLTKNPTTANQETFHPYYDNFAIGVWLKANLIQSLPMKINFEVIRPQNWPIIHFERAQHHFSSLELNNLYTVHAGRELVEIRSKLKTFIGVQNEANLIFSFLTEMKNSFEDADLNSWKSAMYREISNSQWFIQNIQNIV